MSKNFWQQLKRPIFILAPMADVTDSAFRQVVLSCGKPDVFYTEFVSADGLCSEKGRPKLMPHLVFKKMNGLSWPNSSVLIRKIFINAPSLP